MARDVIEDWSRSLRVARRHRHAIARELGAHLEDIQHELELEGWDPRRAEQEALARLGNLEQIAGELSRVHRPRRRRRLGLAFALAGALLCGAYGASGSLASATSNHHVIPHHSGTHPSLRLSTHHHTVPR